MVGDLFFFFCSGKTSRRDCDFGKAQGILLVGDSRSKQQSRVQPFSSR